MKGVADSPYSASRINKGIKHFLLGKGLTSIAGVGTLLLVVRGLEIEQFAAYSILFAIVELLSAITNIGTGQVFTRFIPEIYSRNYRFALRKLIVTLLALRYLVLIAALLLILAFVPTISGWIGLEQWVPAFKLYLLVVLFRTVTSTLFQILEAMLHQGPAQAAVATVTVTRFLLVGGAYYTGQLDLTTLIWIEIITDSVGAGLLIWTLDRACRVRPEGEADREIENAWLRQNRDRMLSFGIKGYIQHLIIMPFSGVVNRLVVGGHLGGLQMALFGFAQSIYDLMQRYMPAQLFVGLIRPVMAARYSTVAQFGEVQTITNLVLKINLILIGLVAVIVTSGGADMLLFVTAGKYGERAVDLLLLMCLLISLESWRHVLDLLSHTVERYGILIFTNAILGSSLVAGILLLPAIGVFALPAANCAGLLIGNLVVVWWLSSTGFPFRHDLRMIIGAALAAICSTAVTLLSRPYIDSWMVQVALGVFVYIGIGVAVLRPRERERDLWSRLLVAGRG